MTKQEKARLSLLMTLHSTAMRRAELCRLKVRDIGSQRMMIRINQGKGRRDRELPLGPKLLETRLVYWRCTASCSTSAGISSPETSRDLNWRNIATSLIEVNV